MVIDAGAPNWLKSQTDAGTINYQPQQFTLNENQTGAQVNVLEDFLTHELTDDDITFLNGGGTLRMTFTHEVEGVRQVGNFEPESLKLKITGSNGLNDPADVDLGIDRTGYPRLTSRERRLRARN